MIELLHIDCMEYMASCADKSFDLAIVDPPYRDASDNAPTKDMREKGGNMRDFGAKPDIGYFRELFRVSKNQIVWGGNNFIDDLRSTNCMIFWYKHQPMDNFSDGEIAWTSFSSVTRCFDFMCYGNVNSEHRTHPTQKPVKLYSWLLQNYAKPGQRILDTHLGSGSSAIAAHYFGCDFVGCEIDKEYYDAAVKRFKQQTAQEVLFPPCLTTDKYSD